MSIDPSEFRRVLGHFVTGVSIVAARDPRTGVPHGLTVNALSSVSLEPPLVLACIEQDAISHGVLELSDGFSVNILDTDAEALSRRFAVTEGGDKFEGVAWHEEATGAPVLDAALAWLDCRVWARHRAGDHTIFIGLVIDAAAREGRPLVFYRGGYGRYIP